MLLDAVHERVQAACSASDLLLAQPPDTLDGLSLLRPESIPSPGPGTLGSYFIGYAGDSKAVQPYASPHSGRKSLP